MTREPELTLVSFHMRGVRGKRLQISGTHWTISVSWDKLCLLYSLPPAAIHRHLPRYQAARSWL